MLHKYFPSQFIWEVFFHARISSQPLFHLKNPAMQDFYRSFNRDCELVSQLPIKKTAQIPVRSSPVSALSPISCVSYLIYMNQTFWFVVDMEMAPAPKAAIISSLSVINPPAITGIRLWLQIFLITLGISPGRISIISG